MLSLYDLMRPVICLLFLACFSLLNTPVYSGTNDSLAIREYQEDLAENLKIVYEGLESNPQFRHGSFELFFNRRKQVSGYYYENARQGIWQKLHPNGKVQITGMYINGKKHGTWNYYHSDGQKGAEMHFVNGIKVGSWSGYYRDGTPSCLYNYKDDVLSGEFVLYYPSKLIAQNTTVSYRDTNLFVNTNKYYDNGKIFEESYFYNNIPDGIYKRYYPNGLIWMDFIYDQGKLIKVNALKTSTGDKYRYGSFRDGSGELKLFNSDATLHSEINYRDGRPSGKARYYYNLNLGIEGFYLRGKRFGEWKYYSEYGKLKTERNFFDGSGRIYERRFAGNGYEGWEGELLDGLQDGTWKQYNFHGDIIEETPYKLGFKHGFARKFEGEVVREKGGYYFGEKVGDWQYYNSNGKITFEEKFIKEVSLDSSLVLPMEIPLPRELNHDYSYETSLSDASYPGGDGPEKKYILDNFKYPDQAKELEINGEIILQFTVDEIGEVGNIRVLRGLGYGCDQRAVALFKSMPFWDPALINGIPTQTEVLRIVVI